MGSNGIVRITSAQSEGEGHFHIGLHLWGTGEELPSKYLSKTDNREVETRDHYYFADTYLGMVYSLTDYFAVRLTAIFKGDHIATRDAADRPMKPHSSYWGNKNLISAELGDTQVGLEFTFPSPKAGNLFVGLKPFVSFPTGIKRSETERDQEVMITKTGGLFRYFTSHPHLEWGVIAPLTLSFEKARYHFNLGFYDRLGREEAVADQLLIGLGAEFPIRNFIPFIEWTEEQWIHDRKNLLAGPCSRLTAGFRIAHPGGVNFDLAYDWRLSPKTSSPSTEKGDELKINSGWGASPNWALHLKLISYCYKLPIGTLVLKIVDAKTGEPLEAEVSFTQKEKVVKKTTNPETGTLTLEDLPQGLLDVAIFKEGYMKQGETIEIKKGQTVHKEIKIFPEEQEIGNFTGRVISAKSGEPLEAIISFPESDLKSISSDPDTGAFQLKDLPTGILVVEVNKAGYAKATATVVIKKQETTVKDFELEPIEKDLGTLTGKVIDSKTGEPLGEAIISFPETEVKSIMTKPGIGTYTASNLPTGIINVEVNKSGYIKQTAAVVIKKGEITIKDFELAPVPRAIITGKVTDKKTGQPLPATISIPDVNSAVCNPETGIYKLVVPPGTYVITASLEKYITQSFPVVAERDKTLIKNFVIVKKGEKIKLEGIYFDIGKATIKPESRPALEEAANFLKENPRMKVEIQGHTDNTGSELYNQKLSEARANAVKAYLIREFDVSASQLTTRGYGESMPVASNTTKEGRAQNRRIEFLILGEE
jgi:outer membrane protein OmpA-like peptidoglycan-associated protein